MTRIGVEFPFAQPYEGVITKRDDPLGIGRVRVRIPGEVEPESGWLLPFGSWFGGSSGKGAIAAPPMGASVLVWFVGCDPENGRYAPSGWGEGEAPEGYKVTDDGDLKVLAGERVRVELDDRGPTAGVRVVDKATGADVVLELDLATRQVAIRATLGVVVQSAGAVRIDGATVTINGRPVAASGQPI